jgi:hypothetical protein
MVTEKWKTFVEDFRYHCLTQPNSSARFSGLQLRSTTSFGKRPTRSMLARDVLINQDYVRTFH